MAYSKTYVVWVGRHPGIYETWDDCRAEVENYPNARYKAFGSRTEAIMAYRESDKEASAVLRAISDHLEKEEQETTALSTGFATTQAPSTATAANPGYIVNSIAVDAGCRGNPGILEYRGVLVSSREEIFRQGPFLDGTNNIGEFLAIVHALALLKQKGFDHIPIYSDSMVARKWVKTKKCNTKIKDTGRNTSLIEIVKRAEAWLMNNSYNNPILKWETGLWGEIPADFGRKK